MRGGATQRTSRVSADICAHLELDVKLTFPHMECCLKIFIILNWLTNTIAFHPAENLRDQTLYIHFKPNKFKEPKNAASKNKQASSVIFPFTQLHPNLTILDLNCFRFFLSFTWLSDFSSLDALKVLSGVSERHERVCATRQHRAVCTTRGQKAVLIPVLFGQAPKQR